MEINVIFGFVLALLAAGCVGLVWITSSLKRETLDEVSKLSTSVSYLRSTLAKQAGLLQVHSGKLRDLEQQSPVELGARVVELSEAVERLRRTHQRFAGRVSQELGPDPRPDNSPPTVDRDALRREHASSIMPASTRLPSGRAGT